MSLDNITREMCNAWKCDRYSVAPSYILTYELRSIASVVTSSQIGRYASELMNWPGAKLAQDDIFVSHHNARCCSFTF